MKYTVAVITLSQVLLVCNLVSVGRGAHLCEGYVEVGGDKYANAAKDLVGEMVDKTPKSPNFTYYDNPAAGHVSGSSRCSGDPGVEADQKACRDCMDHLQTELMACLYNQTASASAGDPDCSISFWQS